MEPKLLKERLIFLWICKIDKTARRCINKDIQKYICSYLLIDLKYINMPIKKMFDKYYWRLNEGMFINPCPECLIPCTEDQFYNNPYFCEIHIKCEEHGLFYKRRIFTNQTLDDNAERFNNCTNCIPYGMCEPCFNNKSKFYLLPS